MTLIHFVILESGGQGFARLDHVWTDIQDYLRRTIWAPITKGGRLTRIARQGGGCCYVDPGVYDVTFTDDTLGDFPRTVKITERIKR